MKTYVKPSITYVELRAEERIMGSVCKVKPNSNEEVGILAEVGLVTEAFFG